MRLGVRALLIIAQLTVDEKTVQRRWFPHTVELFDEERHKLETWRTDATDDWSTDRRPKHDVAKINKMETEYEETSIQKLKRSYRLTMEVPLLLVMFGHNLSGGITTNILLYTACINTLNYTEHECELLLASGPKSNETMVIENEAQQHISIIMMIHSLSVALVPAVLSLFLGAWSDKYGRKPLVAWPLLVSASSGGPRPPPSLHSLLHQIFCSYQRGRQRTGDSSGVANFYGRCISLLEAGILTGTIFGTLSSPYLLDLIGGVSSLAIVAVGYTFGYVFTVLWIPESIQVTEKGSLSSLFDVSLAKDMVKSCIKKRPNKGRRIFVLLTLCTFFVPYTSGLDYLYTRNKLQWSLETFSIFVVATTLLSVVGLVVGVGVLQKKLKINDVWLTMLSCASSIVDYTIKTFATATWHMYFGASISLFRGLAQPIIRSMLSKLMPTEDMAKIFSLLSMSNVAVPMVVAVIFNPLYYATLNDFPGAIYVVCVGMYVMMIVLLCFARHYMQKYPCEPENVATYKANSCKEHVPADLAAAWKWAGSTDEIPHSYRIQTLAVAFRPALPSAVGCFPSSSGFSVGCYTRTDGECFFFVVLPVRKNREGGEKPIMGRPCARAHGCVRLSRTKNLLNNLCLQWRKQNAVTPTSQTRPFRHGDAVGV
ncbi:Solute carrier family 46 member 3 [Eumeta japonica]|uniref:Solute carrier family 46 member 3 n=1 Tax=Eumeta variegata TaxID=151549 RepID=A0A4C1T189_EUMVA|nr:Solute carrier family 46 member 3 [Eumeta japonica]